MDFRNTKKRRVVDRPLFNQRKADVELGEENRVFEVNFT